uniref:Uncharacterized protein n=1 Tax=Arundo donax TaxID=35708 RepID=A0A0A9SWP3_ARUDO
MTCNLIFPVLSFGWNYEIHVVLLDVLESSNSYGKRLYTYKLHWIQNVAC